MTWPHSPLHAHSGIQTDSSLAQPDSGANSAELISKQEHERLHLLSGQPLQRSRDVADLVNRLDRVFDDRRALEDALDGKTAWSAQAFADARALMAAVPCCLLDKELRDKVTRIQADWQLQTTKLPALGHVLGYVDLRQIRTVLRAAIAPQRPTADALRSRLARLAGWEAQAANAVDADARALGAAAVRQLLLEEILVSDAGELWVDAPAQRTHDSARSYFSLPLPDELESLGLAGQVRVMHVGQCVPLDAAAYGQSCRALGVTALSVPAPATHLAELLTRDIRRVTVSCRPDTRPSSIDTIRQLMRTLPDYVRELWVMDDDDALRAVMLDMGEFGGWRQRPGWRCLERPESPPPSLFDMPQDFVEHPGGGRLMAFLGRLSQQLTDMPPEGRAYRMDEARARASRLLQAIRDRPALLDELEPYLLTVGGCVDAHLHSLTGMDLAARAGFARTSEEAAGMLLRMALLDNIDRQVGLTIDSSHPENLEQVMALHALLDKRLATVTGRSFDVSFTPFHRRLAGMRPTPDRLGDSARDGQSMPDDSEWPPEMHALVDRVIGEEVSADFQSVRDLLESFDGPSHRAVERLMDQPVYRGAEAAWRQRYLEIEARAQGDEASAGDRAAYEAIQADMPRELRALRFSLMDGWLSPLRKAYLPSAES